MKIYKLNTSQSKSTGYITLKYLDVKDNHRKNTPSNKVLTKSMNMRIWEIGSSNQLFKRGSYTENKFSKIIM